MTEIPSPCIQICVMDPATGLCQGCLRTLEEIAAWGMLSQEEKKAILEKLAVRKTQGLQKK